MSPEQVQNSKDVDRRADVWSLGTSLYCALTGRAPHQDAESPGKLIVTICGTPAPPLHERAPWVSPEVAEVVHRALAIDREQRWPSAGAMLEAIRRLAPDGFALREDMLTGVGANERASVASAAAAGPGASTAPLLTMSTPLRDAGATAPVLEHEGGSSAEQAAVPTAAGHAEPRRVGAGEHRPRRIRGFRIAGAALVLGLGAAEVHWLLRKAGPTPIAGAPAFVVSPMASSPPTAASVPAADAALDAADARTAVRDSGIAVDRGSGHPKAGRNAVEVVEIRRRSEPAPRRGAQVESAMPTVLSSTAAPSALPSHKPEDSLMPALPP